MNLDITPELHERLEALGKARGRPLSSLITDALHLYLELHESSEGARTETIERWQRFEKTGECVDGAAVEAWLESWGSDTEQQCPKPDV
jgi:predicted transcriptional regulator